MRGLPGAWAGRPGCSFAARPDPGEPCPIGRRTGAVSVRAWHVYLGTHSAPGYGVVARSHPEDPRDLALRRSGNLRFSQGAKARIDEVDQ
jgi:hypothetical protein